MKRKSLGHFTKRFSHIIVDLLKPDGSTSQRRVTVQSTPNIATIKYWGKRDDYYIHPLNENISVTLDYPTTTTSVIATHNLDEHKLFVNGQSFPVTERLQRMIYLACDNSTHFHSDRKLKFCFISENNFPTASGLASSASGNSAIAFGLCELLGVSDQKLVSCIARTGSGSACRSVYGGFSKWINEDNPYTSEDYSSYAQQLHDAKHWKELEVLVCVVTREPKKISSTEGQRLSRLNSEKIWTRVNDFVPSVIGEMETAIAEKDARKFFELTILDCENFHDVCLDTTPRLEYRNNTSFEIVDIVNSYNDFKGSACAGYTFDAGPNAVIFCENRQIDELKYVLQSLLMDENEQIVEKPDVRDSIVGFVDDMKDRKEFGVGDLKRIIHTKVGTGPKQVEFDWQMVLDLL